MSVVSFFLVFQGIMTRVYESLALCVLLIAVIFCLAHLVSILLDEGRSRNESLLSKRENLPRSGSSLVWLFRNLELSIAFYLFLHIDVGSVASSE